MDDPIYLDHNATTPLAPEALEAMNAAAGHSWGNPSSTHAYGARAREEVERARVQVATLIGCATDEVVFTSGGTESDNAALVGVAEARTERGRHVVTSVIEHPAVDASCGYLESRGWQVTRVPVDTEGRVDAAACAAVCSEQTVLVSVMHANNETGVLQPVREIAARAHERGVVVHTDAAQSVGKMEVRVDDLGVDLLTIAGHKLYGPQGVGVLYVRRGTPFAGFLRGAGHEAGRRAGTENVVAIAGLGAACALATRDLPRRTEHLRSMRDRLERGLRRTVPDLVVHGAGARRIPNTLFVALPRADAAKILELTPEVAMGSGAACHSGQAGASGMLGAMGVAEELARCTLRLSVGATTTAEDVDRAVERIGDAAQRLRG